MNSLFQRTSSYWVKYNEYEYQQDEDSILYLAPASKAKPSVYDPLKDSETMIIDALNVGMLAMNRTSEDKMKHAMLEFVSKYGLLGFMSALPTTPQFMDYNAVYLPKNHFLKEEIISTEDYVSLFFPFSKPNFQKDEYTARWNVKGDREMIALAATFADQPQAMNMSFQRDYAERYDWLATQFKDWAFSFCASMFYYEETDEMVRGLHRQAMSAFAGIAPTYHIALHDKPTIVWDFHSLLLGIQMMFSFALTDESKPLRSCKHCTKIFPAEHPNAVFCSPRCKNQYNVYKSRGKK